MRCHEITEIYPGIFLSGAYDVPAMIDMGIEVFAALSPMPEVENGSYRVVECRIRDMDVAGEEELDELLSILLEEHRAGKRIGIFCSGGHGRTGYVAACLLASLGIEEPVGYIHRNYCINAIESREQYAAVEWYVRRLKRK